MTPPTPRPAKTTALHFRSDQETVDMAREMARRESGSVGALLRRLIRAEYQRQERAERRYARALGGP